MRRIVRPARADHATITGRVAVHFDGIRVSTIAEYT
jgi:hypothetical protein